MINILSLMYLARMNIPPHLLYHTSPISMIKSLWPIRNCVRYQNHITFSIVSSLACSDRITVHQNFNEISQTGLIGLLWNRARINHTHIHHAFSLCILRYSWLIWFDFWCFNATFNNISTISCRPVLVVEEAEVLGENDRPWANFITCDCE